jgi:hypothetical protein
MHTVLATACAFAVEAVPAVVVAAAVPAHQHANGCPGITHRLAAHNIIQHSSLYCASLLLLLPPLLLLLLPLATPASDAQLLLVIPLKLPTLLLLLMLIQLTNT